MKRLYVTDLDGTLLNNRAALSARSAAILNRLIEQGAWISVATARSPIGLAMTNLRQVRFRLPLVLMNGALLYDLPSSRILEGCCWQPGTAAQVLEICRQGGKTPFLYRVEDGKMDIVFTGLTSEGERAFYRSRAEKFPGAFRQVPSYPLDEAVYCSMQDSESVLRPIRERLQGLPDVASVLYADTYRKGNWYLEVFSARAGKGNGVRRLRDRLGARAVTAFGDNDNDLPMLAMADTACAVANGTTAVREKADVIIPSNEEDGVAVYLLNDFRPDGQGRPDQRSETM
ncbi:MAG TPA: Cof-type HAD-IIB family hydrolase [Firmicutes bacterium]|nr:Cof-type HAD-IIB family hydrolase [Bacillota bacterium]